MSDRGKLRPVLRYHGGKWLLAPWIMDHFPRHRIYVEAFGGAASVLVRKERSYAEVYNDLDDEVVNLFEVVRSARRCRELMKLLERTPFARTEWRKAYEGTRKPVERARRLLVRSFMGFGSASFNAGYVTGFRSNSNRSGTTPAHDWKNLRGSLPVLCERLQGVVIEKRDALKVIGDHDSRETLFYVDPPYPHGTRNSSGQAYRHELTDAGHRELAKVLHQVEGMVVLSGYGCGLYDEELYADWKRVQRAAYAGNANGRSMRDEVLWLNRACVRGLEEGRAQLDWSDDFGRVPPAQSLRRTSA